MIRLPLAQLLLLASCQARPTPQEQPKAFPPTGPDSETAMPTGETASPVLLELYTSEGCSSCPSADDLLAELDDGSGRAIALAFHVDYWNELGWVDPFSSPMWTERQQGYGRAFATSRVYTPQLVVAGTREFVGSDRKEANRAIGAASGAKTKTRLSLVIQESTPTSLHVAFSVTDAPWQAQLHIATTRRRESTTPKRGENAGRSLHHVHVVSDLVTRAAETGSQWVNLPAGKPGEAELVAWVQSTKPAPGGGLPVLATVRLLP